MNEDDYGTRLVFNINDADGNPVVLDGGTVKLITRLRGEIQEYECIIHPVDTGKVYYDLEDGFFNYSGRLEMELDVTLPSGHWTSNREIEIVKDKIKE